MGGEDDFRRFRRQLAPILGSARLHHDGAALRRLGDHQRSAHTEELALVVEHMQLGRIVELRLRPIKGQGAIVETVPQAADNLDEFACAAIARLLGRMNAAAKVARLGRMG